MIRAIMLSTPLSDQDVEKLRMGDRVLFDGVVYTARDSAHRRLVDLIKEGKELPFDLSGQVIYYVGPSPARPGQVIGSAGPTSSYRMDPSSPYLIAKGLKGMVGKGPRSQEVVDAMMKYKCVYFATVGGAGALLAKAIKKSEVIAYEDLGPEAIRRLEVEDFPAIVAQDVYGGNLYVEGVKRYAR